ncbi:PAS domain S-box protein [Belliella kenyensis]|uniref:histidine kinase n=1 Tax=Belliella kenyensis TaxID=1472724 RepID=A0ABV8EKN5_9BACT|nr:PAS domain S-box protein [Belliella kenyensis]MCH7403302.1 PAS domain S-box protein [Belliella kenyensis]MDN3602943.1 PAS domain S-box protein [Belliella kenyensis]
MEKSLNHIEELCKQIKNNDQVLDFLTEMCFQNIWFWDIHHPEEIWINEKMRLNLGYESPLDRVTWNGIIFQKDLEASSNAFIDYLNRKRSSFDQTVRFRHQDGHTCWYRCQGSIISEPNGDHYRAIGFFSNLTKQKEQEIKSQLIFEDTNTGVWELDIGTGNTTWSETVYAIHEIPRGFDHNMYNGIEFYHPDYRSIIYKAIENCIKEDISFNLECILITALQNQKWVKATGSKIGNKLIGSFQDITEIKEQELKFKGIFNSTFAFIGFLNTDGVLLEANDTAVKMAGITHDDVIGKYFWDCYWWQISTQTQEELKRNFQIALSGKSVEYEVEVWVAGKTAISILFSLKPIFDDYNNVVYVIPEGRAIQEIIETRNRYKAVLEGTQAGTYEWDIESDHVIINDKFADLLGYSQEELQAIPFKHWSKFVHEDDLPLAYKMIVKNFKKELNLFELEMRLKHKSGYWIWVNVRGKISAWSESSRALKMYGTFIEITKRKNAEHELLYNKNILEALYNLSPIGIALNDYETGKFLDINQKLLEPTGYTKEEFLSLSYWDVTPIEYQELEHHVLYQMRTKGQYELFEKEYIRKDGSRYPVSLQGVLITDVNGRKLIWSFIRDITIEKESKRKLHEAIGNLQAILDASTQVSIIATDQEGLITHFNSGAEKMLGYKAEELIGKSTPSLIHLQSEINEAAQELSLTDELPINGFEVFIHSAIKHNHFTKEWTFVRKDGSTFPVLLSFTTVKQESQVTGFLGIATDISSLKNVEKDIKSLLDITQDQNKRLRNFAHIVSHNLRSHGSGIDGLLEIFTRENPTLQGNELLSLLDQATKNLMGTIEDLTEVVQVNLNNKDKRQIYLRKIIQKNLESLSAQLSLSKCKVIFEVSDELSILAVPAYMDSIVLNFITNAIKYRSLERSPQIEIFTTLKDDRIFIHFKDNGLGIDLEKYGSSLFGMYKTFHQHEDARGVGLFITKNQIESMGGSIDVQSKVGEGTTFIVSFPKD